MSLVNVPVVPGDVTSLRCRAGEPWARVWWDSMDGQ